MPKDLYLAKNMEDLVTHSEVKIPKSTPYKKCLSLMIDFNNYSLRHRAEEDEEMEYCMLHRFMNLATYLPKAVEDKNFKEKRKMAHNLAKKNLVRLSELQDRLRARYEARENKSKALLNGSVNPPESNNIPDNSKKVIKPAPSSESTTPGYIDYSQLYSHIKSRQLKNTNASTDGNPLMLILDVRSAEDFKLSHLKCDNLLNVPNVTSGISASSFRETLSATDKVLWDKRGEADILVLLDWSTSSSSMKPNSKVIILRNMLIKWDPLTVYKSTPQILDGGYEGMVERYPWITTNPKVDIPREPSTTSTDTLRTLEYPLEDLEPERPKPKSPPQGIRRMAAVSVDRSVKPTITGTKNVVTDENLNNLISELDDVLPNEKTMDTTEPENETVTEPIEVVPPETQPMGDSSPDDYPSNGASLTPPESKIPDRSSKPNYNSKSLTTVSAGSGPSASVRLPSKPQSATNSNSSGVTREQLKKDGPSGGILRRSSSSPNIKKIVDDEPLNHPTPSFTRANKPSTPKIQHYLFSERADSIHGKTAPGLTGLKNFANNCYMNSILQCLNNTKPLVQELLRLQSSHSVNVGSRQQGRIAQEVIAAFRSMWSGEVKVYSIRELKSLMGDIKDIFKGSMHQDSNEFLIILLEHLHEDLNMPAEVENLVGAVEETGEKAWGEFRRKNCSIIQQLFYGQHRSTVTCSTCGHNSATFEQFFNLFVPIPSNQSSVSINDCIQLYMSGERISGWKCPNCKVERNATKKFDISRLPPVLIIALKRFTQEDGSWLHKKENLVTYPLTDLNMSRFTVPGSEQRHKVYDLYAMSTHSGTLQSGHYRAICKNPWNKNWYMFDDQSVDQLSESSVLTNPEVYIMFYIAQQHS